MKFSKYLEREAATFCNPEMATYLFPYRAMKKWLRASPTAAAQFRDTIDDYSRTTDKIVVRECDRLFCPPSVPAHPVLAALAQCFRRGPAVIAPATESAHPAADILRLCHLNQTAFYKICKKTEKHGIPGMWRFYQDARNSHKYKFLGSLYTARLELESVSRFECPICFEEYSRTGGTEGSRQFIILSCGHTLCYDCLKNYTQMDRIRATLSNKLAIVSRQSACPVCRGHNIFDDIKPFIFFPTPVHRGEFQNYRASPVAAQGSFS